MKILLPMDGSTYSQQALRALLAQVHTRETQVHVLHVVEPVAAYVTAGMVPELVDSTAAIEMDRRAQAKALVTNASQKLRKARFKATGIVTTGDAKTVIIDHAEKWGADLIILGSHGLKGLGRFLMGSVSDAVIRHAACSVLIVRHRPAGSASRRRKS